MFPSSVQHASLLGSARAAAREEVEEVSHSFRDVFSVMGSKHSTTGQKSLLSSELNGASPPCVQVSENDLAEFIIVSEPEGTSLQMGGLHPRASLFERPVNMMQAQVAHAEFRQLMRENGVRVLTVREVLAHGVERVRGTDCQPLTPTVDPNR
jgi:hypothetical protein